jgi:hypothetical protein
MSDPISSSVATAAGWKLIGGLAGIGALGAGLSAVVVMCVTPPRSPREWIVGLVSTVLGSIGGGSAVIQHYGLQSWAYEPTGLVAMLGLVFACGLPGWAVVRWLFNFIEGHKGQGLDDVVADVRKGLGQ